jgi:polyhydroxyalkanoate synthase
MAFQPQPVPPSEQRREGSTWQGGQHTPYPEASIEHASADLVLNAWLGQLTGHVSPAALALAWQDWGSHLLLSPDKQMELGMLAVSNTQRWLRYGASAALAYGNRTPAEPLQPLAQDKRFADPAWHTWPWNLFSQGFLLTQQWWHRATSGVRGVSPHHTDVVTFVTRQLLDSVAPSNFLATNPVVQQATVASNGRNLMHGALRAATEARNVIAGISPPVAFRPGVDVAVTPGKVVMANRLVELLRYDPVTPTVHETPLLIVPAWIMKYYILDLSPYNSLVRYLVAQGHTVFMISWHNPTAEDRELNLNDYLENGVLAAIDVVRALVPGQPVNAAGYCLGGTLLAMSAAALACAGKPMLNTMTLLAAQTDFSEAGELQLFIDESQVTWLEDLMWEQGYLDNRQMAGAFRLLRSNDLVWSIAVEQYLLGRRAPMNDLFAWNTDTTRMPYRMHSDYLRHLFLHNDLFSGRYRVAGRPIALTDLELPIFAVATMTDHVSPWRSVHRIHLLSNCDVAFVLTSGGHNAGIVSEPGHAGRHYYSMERHRGDCYIDADTWLAEARLNDGSWWPSWASWLGRNTRGARVPARAVGPSLTPAPGTYVLER